MGVALKDCGREKEAKLNIVLAILPVEHALNVREREVSELIQVVRAFSIALHDGILLN